MHDFGARASAPWKIFCFLLKFLLNKCYKCRVGSKKSESREVGWLFGAGSDVNFVHDSEKPYTDPACMVGTL